MFLFMFQFGQLVPELRALEHMVLPLLLAGLFLLLAGQRRTPAPGRQRRGSRN